MVEDGSLSVIELYDLLLLGGNEGDVLSGFLVDLFVVHVDVAERVVEQIPEDGGGFGVLGEEDLHALALGDFLPGTFPFVDEALEFGHQHAGVLAFSCGADYSSVVLGKDAAYQCFEAFLLFLAGDLLRHVYLVGKRHQYYVASCQ